MSALRSAQEARRSTQSSALKHVHQTMLKDADLDEDGDMPFPDDLPGNIALLLTGPDPEICSCTYRQMTWQVKN